MIRKNILCIFVWLFSITAIGQDQKFSKYAIKSAVGAGWNDGQSESGEGLLYKLGFQRSFGTKERIRVNAGFVYGDFASVNVDDAPDEHFSSKSIVVSCDFDALKRRQVSLLVSVGFFAGVTKGYAENYGLRSNEIPGRRNFESTYSGIDFGIGLRINKATSRIAWDFKPFNLQRGNHGFVQIYALAGIDVKL